MSLRNFKINEEQCLEALDSIYSEMVYNSIGATKDEWPAAHDGGESLESAIMFHLQNSLANDVERLIWGGTGNAVAGIQDGIIDKALADALDTALKEAGGKNSLSFIEVKCAIGARGDLGRPTSTPLENKEAFIRELRKETTR